MKKLTKWDIDQHAGSMKIYVLELDVLEGKFYFLFFARSYVHFLWSTSGT